MKEIIYLDTEIMNSLLAQLDQGITSSYSNEQTNQTSEGVANQSSVGKKSGIDASIKMSSGALPGGEIGFGSSIGSSDGETETSSRRFTEGQRDLLNKKFHDYSLDILINKLKDNELLINDELNEGDLIESTGQYDFYDFSLINAASNADMWKEVMGWEESDTDPVFTKKEAKRVHDKIISGKTLTKKEEDNREEALAIHQKHIETNSIVDIMKMMEVYSSTTDRLFRDLTFIKSRKLVGLLKKEFLRESTESLSFRGKNSRKAIILGRVIGIKDTIIDGQGLTDFSPKEINKIPNILLDILLGSFDILEVGDTLISPIAIFYESN